MPSKSWDSRYPPNHPDDTFYPCKSISNRLTVQGHNTLCLATLDKIIILILTYRMKFIVHLLR